jgi:hypothetical protein
MTPSAIYLPNLYKMAEERFMVISTLPMLILSAMTSTISCFSAPALNSFAAPSWLEAR